jgi:hypothetical protein
MANKTNKLPTHLDYQQTIRNSFNEVDFSVSSSGFLTAKAGRKITQTIKTTTLTDDTAEFSYFEDGNLLYTIKVVYTDSTQAVMLSCERTA